MTEPTQLHAYADNELTPQEANALRESLRHDPSASAEVDAVLNLKDFLAKNCARHENDEAWRSCVRRLDEIDKAKRVEGFVGRYAWALCAALFLFILSGRAAMRNVQGDSARTADLASFGRSVAPVTEANRAQSRFYEEILGQVGRNLDPNAIEIGQPMRGMVHDLQAACIPMRDRKGDLILLRIGGLLNIQDTVPASPSLSAGVVDGENCVVWHVDGETWVLRGMRSVESLGEVAARLAPAK